MQKIPTLKLIPGMILAKDVYSADDTLILTENFCLTDRTIAKLEFYSIHHSGVNSPSFITSPLE